MKLTFTATKSENGIQVNGSVEGVSTEGELLLLIAAIGMKCDNLIAEAHLSHIESLNDEEPIFIHHHPDNDLSNPYLREIVDAAIQRLKEDE